MKKRNDLIVAKVEKLTAEQLAEKDYIPEEEKNDDFYASQRKAAQAEALKEKETSLPLATPFSEAEKLMQNEDNSVSIKIKSADPGRVMKRTDTILTNPAGRVSPRIAQKSKEDEESQDPRRSN